MSDEIPKLDDWLAEYRSRPEPTEVVISEAPAHDPEMPSLVTVRIARYDETGWPNPTGGFYLFGLDDTGSGLFDLWFETLRDAVEAAEDDYRLRREAWSPPLDL